MGLSATLKRAVGILRGPTLIYLLASGLARLGAIVLIPLYTRRLSSSGYGDYALAQTMVAVLPTVMSLGLFAAIPRAYFDAKSPKEGIAAAGSVSAWTVLVVAINATLLLGLILLFAQPGAGSIYHQWELMCVTVAATGSVLTTIPALCLRSSQRSFAAAGWQLLEFASVTGSGLILVGVLHRGVRGAIEALALAYLICGVLGAGFVFFGIRGRLRRGVLRPSLAFAFPFVPHLLANWAQLAGDRWSLKIFGFEHDLGRYVLAVQLASPAALAMTAFHDAESARIGEMFRTGGMKKLREAFPSIQRRYLVATALPSFVVLLGLPIVPYFLGASFRSSVVLVPIVLALTLVDSAYFPSSNIVYFAGRTKVIPVVTVAGAIVNLVANVLFVPLFGMFGGLIARGAGYLVRSGAMWMIARRCLHEATTGTEPEPEPPTLSPD